MITIPSKLKLIAIGVVTISLVGIVSWASWSLASSRTEARERAAADIRVQEAVARVEERLQLQQELTRHFRSLAEQELSKLMHKLDNLKVEHVTITRNVTVERESNPEFYNTPLPEGGIKEWESARQLLQ